jgi:nitroimidazol reductase NimA-like FMN-containing flavoprotein (pyridoxamine 5'-phosphate oxidase superfamily)
MRRSDKALPNDDIVRILQEGEYGVLSTVDEAGQPYGVPLNYSLKDNCLYFHCALEGHKLDNLFANEKTSFCVVGRTRVIPAEFTSEFESVIVTGTAAVVLGEEKYEALVSLIEKYSADFVEEGRKYIEKLDSQTKVVRIKIESMTGKLSPTG